MSIFVNYFPVRCIDSLFFLIQAHMHVHNVVCCTINASMNPDTPSRKLIMGCTKQHVPLGHLNSLSLGPSHATHTGLNK